jgi:hypothetical protein
MYYRIAAEPWEGGARARVRHDSQADNWVYVPACPHTDLPFLLRNAAELAAEHHRWKVGPLPRGHWVGMTTPWGATYQHGGYGNRSSAWSAPCFFLMATPQEDEELMAALKAKLGLS